MKKTVKLCGFTLAETLVTLAIVGVVAALTVPVLKNHADEAKFVALTQKAFTDLSAATTALELKHNDARFWTFGSIEKANKVTDWYREIMGGTSYGIKANGTSEETWIRYKLNGESAYNYNPHFQTPDGIVWNISSGSHSQGGTALIDLNGSDPPNVIGVDIQGFRIGSDYKNGKYVTEFGVYPMGDNLNDTNAVWACTSYVIKHKKMPWLKGGATDCSDYLGK